MHLASFGPVDERSRAQLETCARAAREHGERDARGVLCADHHPGYSMPIGGVLALREWVMPAGVGYDIACGNCCVRTPVQARDVDVSRVMDEIWRSVSFGMGRKNAERVDHAVLDAIAESPVLVQRGLLALAREQLGTVGSGNHYVDLFENRADGALWVGVHFGSRGFGHRTASGFLSIAAGGTFADRVRDRGMDSAPLMLSLHRPSGQDYLEAMRLAGEYAYAGREWVVRKVLQILGTTAVETVHNHHNYAWWERHGGHRLLVIRKGATPAFPGQRGFVGGSMGDDAVVVRGVESSASQAALYSTVHGAGRIMSRREAAGRVSRRRMWACGRRDCPGRLPMRTSRRVDGANPPCPLCGGKTHARRVTTQERAGRVDWPAARARLDRAGIELRGGGADEAPEAYKRLDDVLACHVDTIAIEHRLRPIGVAMAGPDATDPYRD